VTLRVESLSDSSRWDAYVGPRAGTITDTSQWFRVVDDAYGIRTVQLIAADGDRAVGALALHEIKHPVFGHYLTTSVFGNDGGFFYDSDAARDALLAESSKVGSTTGAAYVVIRTRTPIPGLAVDDRYRASVLDLSSDSEAMLAALPGPTRNQVRRGMKEGFTVSTGPEQLEPFFDVFHEHMRDLGSPAHSLKYYETIQHHLRDSAEWWVVRDGARLVAGALLFRVNDLAMNLHTVSLREFNKRCANYLLYWRMIESAAQRGLKTFDMGRSEAGSTQLKFKENWGTREVPLFYNYQLLRTKSIPTMSPRDPKFRIASAVWSRLPVAVTKIIGPRLISGLA
jgi:serine/alanine adding enzyme